MREINNLKGRGAFKINRRPSDLCAEGLLIYNRRINHTVNLVPFLLAATKDLSIRKLLK